ncbi:MAG: hypothetical protein HOV83_36375 [Catenulispora sp.]|nr:hypothetical protein [Catenulispora sp.]
MLNTLTLGERNLYSSAHALTLPVTVVAVNVLAVAGGHPAVVLLVAAVAGFCLAGWSRLLYSLIDTGNRRITPLISLATVGLLLAGLVWSWATTLGIAVLLLVCWLPFMAAESAGQVIRERALWSQTASMWRLAQWGQAVIDLATIAATGVFLAACAGGQLSPLRLAATLILIVPLLLSRAADRSGPLPPLPDWLTGGWSPWPMPPHDPARDN